MQRRRCIEPTLGLHALSASATCWSGTQKGLGAERGGHGPSLLYFVARGQRPPTPARPEAHRCRRQLSSWASRQTILAARSVHNHTNQKTPTGPRHHIPYTRHTMTHLSPAHGGSVHSEDCFSRAVSNVHHGCVWSAPCVVTRVRTNPRSHARSRAARKHAHTHAHTCHTHAHIHTPSQGSGCWFVLRRKG